VRKIASLAGLPLIQATALHDVAAERARQDAKWGEQNHAPEVWLAILTEEVRELATAILRARFQGYDHRRTGDLRTEAVQVAAVAVAFVEMLDRHPTEGSE
jgi:NTP pyrophosphatase (non-canonical NTP hydrolase)